MTEPPLPPPSAPDVGPEIEVGCEADEYQGSDGAPDGDPARLRHPVALIAAAVGIGAAAAIVVGFPVGFAMMAASNSSCSPQDGWCELGGAIFGMFAGAVAAAITYVVAGVMFIKRRRRPGRRAPYVVAHIATPWVLGAGLAILGAVTEALR